MRVLYHTYFNGGGHGGFEDGFDEFAFESAENGFDVGG